MAQTTTSSTTHSIVKYSSCKTPLTNVAKDIQWKHYENGHDQLRLTLSVIAAHTSTQSASMLGSQSLARHHLKIAYLSDDADDTQNTSQNANNEVVFESLDLTSFSEIKYNAKELPLKAVHKSRSVAVRYLFPMIQDSASLQTYRRFQVTFKTEEDAKSFIDAIQFVCPCSVAKDKRPVEPQATQHPAPHLNRQATEAPATQRIAKAPTRRAPTSRPAPASQISNPPLPRNETTYRKSTMFADVLSSSSLGEAGSSQSNGGSSVDMSRQAVGGLSFREPTRVHEGQDNRMDIDEPVDDVPSSTQFRLSASSSAPQNGSFVGSVDPSQIRSGPTPARAVQTSAARDEQPPAGTAGSAERDGTAEVAPATLLSSIRQGDSGLYNLSSTELRLLVTEVMQEPGFPELGCGAGREGAQDAERDGTGWAPTCAVELIVSSAVWMCCTPAPVKHRPAKPTPLFVEFTDLQFIVFASADIQMVERCQTTRTRVLPALSLLWSAAISARHLRLVFNTVFFPQRQPLPFPDMATRPPLPHHGSHPGPARHHLSRLHVPQSISVTPNYFSEQALFTPGPTTGQAFMANNFPHGPQTAFLINTPGPGQSSFLAQQQQNRPPSMHRHHASLAIGMPPMTPGGGMFQQQQFAAMAGMQQQPGGLGLPPFVPRSKRTISIGGPPKAVLGGPNRKTSPMPPTPAGESAPGLPDVKKKKCTVKLPLEADLAPEDESDTRVKSLWSRTPVPASQLPPELVIDGELEATTAEPHPDHVPRKDLPGSIAVFLPTKLAWDILRQEVIEEKLAKLGVERGSGANYLPSQSHGRAFSISTPADPSLLFSKLNKLQASQSPSSTSSPGPNSPFFHQPRLPHQHGYTQSLAVHQSGFGYSPQLGGGLDLTTQKSPGLSTSISIASDSESQGPVLHAPQGVVPVRATALSRPDFVRGFGLDVTEEEDEGQEEEPETQTPSDQNDLQEVQDGNGGFTQAFGQTFQVRPIVLSHSQPEPEASEEDADDEGDDSMTAAAHSRHHSRHLSHASLRSLGRRTMSEEPPVNRISREDDLPEGESEYEQSQARSAVEAWEGQDSSEVAQSESGVDEIEVEPEVADWTGSDTESTGEWSNPSDEERHRHERRVRKLARAQGNVNLPRRIPEFPHPPHVHSEPYLPQRVDRAQSEDIVSNPSEEGFVHVHSQVDSIHSHIVDQHQSGSLSPRPFRPLPPVPQSATHSRQASANFVFSQTGSAEMRHVEPHSRGTSLVSQSGYGREALNPLAKPFVFGSIRGSSTSSIPFSQPVRGSIGSPSEFGPIAPPAGAHSRHASVSTVAPSATATKLNAGATEFKPSGGLFGNSSFTFQAPPGVPTLTFGSTDSTSSRPLPDIPHQSPARAVQGREKRQRKISDGVGLENTELDSPVEKIQKETPGRDNIATWRYPQSDTSPIVAPKPTVALNPAAKPFSFTGLVARVPVPVEAPHSTVSAPVGPVEKTPLTIFAPQTKRATLPEFALQSSNNTVPASVFKSLSQSDGPTRPTVRSRLSSREAFEGHSNRPSLDDLNVPSISLARKVSKPILVVQNENTPPRPSIDVFGPVQSSAQKPLAKSPIPGFLKLGAPPRRPSPSPNKSRLFSPDLVPSSPSEVGAPSKSDIRSVVQQVLEAKMDTLRKDLTSALSGVKDFSLGHRTSDSTAAHSELDLELIRSTIESGQLSTRSMLQRELAAVMDRMDLISAAQAPHTLEPAEESGAQLASVLHPIAQLASQLTSLEESIRQQRLAGQQDLLEQVVSSLRPQLEAVRAVPIDTDALTIQLSQAVKPHISQLIDLASDKRETAALIVQHLAPALNNIQPPRIDTASLAAQTASALKSSIPAPTDPHVLKEHVADLVVERLDSRLAVRDSSYNAETISRKVMDALEPVLRPTELASAVSQVAEMSKNQQDVLSKTQDLVRAQEAQSTELAGLPKALEEAVASLKSAQTDFMDKLNSLTPLEDVQKVAAENLNLQTQLGTARVAQEQVTTEKDALAERLRVAEIELAALRAAAAEHDAVVAARDAEVAATKSKEAAAQAALSEAQVKIEKSEALIRVKQERIASLEKVNDEKVQESHDLHMKVNTLELQVTYTTRDLESSKRVVSQLENQRNSLMAQQKHWDDLRRTADRVESLCQQMEQEDSEEIAELKRKVDESKILQGEHAYLKKRFEDQERRIADFNRGQQTAKQTVAQAQQQAAEWERRAKEAETELETYRTRAEELEDANTQLHANFTQLQLKVKDLTDEEEKRKQQTQSMQNQIVALEHQLDAVKGELAEATRPQTPIAPVPQRNGVVTGLPIGMHRSLSRLSQSTSVYTPTRQGTSNSLHAPNGMTNGKLDHSTGSASPPPEGVWASMHAPAGTDSLIPPQTPRPSHARQAQHHRPRVPSPAQSIASTAITRDDDGWYS